MYDLYHKKLTEHTLMMDPKFLWCCHVRVFSHVRASAFFVRACLQAQGNKATLGRTMKMCTSMTFMVAIGAAGVAVISCTLCAWSVGPFERSIHFLVRLVSTQPLVSLPPPSARLASSLTESSKSPVQAAARVSVPSAKNL